MDHILPTLVRETTDVQLGLNISHPQRSDLRIKLWGWGAGAPAVDVIDFGSSVNAPNLEVGKYSVTVIATARAGNSTSMGTYEVNVLDLALGSHRTYLPLLAKNVAIADVQFESKGSLAVPDNKATEIAAPIVSAITNMFQWLTPSP